MGTRHKGAGKEVRALDAYIKLMRAAESVSARLAPHLAKAGLTVSQFGALEALYHLGPLCQRDLGKKILKSGGNITMVVDNLEKRGLVERVRGEGDRRYVTVNLTKPGRKLIGELFPRHAGAIREEMCVLSDAELEKLGSLCKRVGLKEKS
ncbi:MAG TPA: MarR family transcriptional regulator [Pyrinomonadaceae bacterium]|jgi:MarR family 2-MHQ and catechol resistance regulon transcriptional repressor